MQLDREMRFFEALMKAVTGVLGNSVEAVLHDLNQPPESTIVRIRNGHVTGRKIGDCGGDVIFEVLRTEPQEDGKYSYYSNTRDGKVLRSSSVYIRDDEGKIRGMFCINLDITDLIVAQRSINGLLEKETDEANFNPKEEFLVNDVNQLLHAMLQKVQEEIGKPVSYMNREEKVAAIKYLDRKGAFLISKASSRIAKFFGVSKVTLYSYLDDDEEN